jgi:endonuclease YncB( thermonuclease family)
MYEYSARLVRVVDGDTIHAAVDLGFDTTVNVTIRLYGVNAPEISTADGRVSKSWVQRWFDTHCPDNQFRLQTIKDRREKYGRYLGRVLAAAEPDSANLNVDLVDTGHAVPYFPK